MGRNFPPVACIFLFQIYVFLSKLDQNSLFLNFKFLKSHFFDFRSHLKQEIINCVYYVLTGSLRGLNAELGSKHVSRVDGPREHYVSELLLGPQLVEKWLAEALHHD